jgi:hypothetical protein
LILTGGERHEAESNRPTDTREKGIVDRLAFETAVSRHSPLTPSQIETLIGEVTAENRRITWQFMKMTPKQQYAVWHIASRFPDARVEAIR